MRLLSLFSGGLDSVCFTAKYIKAGNQVDGLLFDYGQKNENEIHVALELAQKLNMHIYKYHIPISLAGNQLTDEKIPVSSKYDPSIILPLRNGIFLMYALSLAYTYHYGAILIGAQSDSIKTFVHGDHTEMKFPDESPIFFSMMEKAGDRGTFECQEAVHILSPVQQNISKADLIKIGKDVLGDDLYKTWTCRGEKYYKKQCGSCEACIGRKKAFLESGVRDWTNYVNE